MKKIQLLIYVMVAMCMTLHSCQKNEPEQPVEKGMKVVHFYAEEINTKTAFDDPVDGTYPTLWTANDENVKISLNYATAVDAEVIPSDDNKTASFKATMEDDESGSYQFYAMSPSSAQFNPISSATKSIGVVVPATQTHIEGSVDEAAQILFAKSETTAEFPASVNLSFKHALAYGKISFSNLDLGDAVITSVSLTASKNIAGRYNYNFETATLTENSASSTITINTSNKSDIWFACAPVDLSNGGTMKFVINTNAGTYTRMVTFPADKGNFVAGHVAKFSVNMQGVSLEASDVYSLVTNIEELTKDSKVIIVASTEDYAISTTQNGNNRAQAGIVKKGNKIENPSEGVQVFDLVVGEESNTAAFKVDESYLYSEADKNYLKTGYLNLAASWKISVTPEGIATINNAQNTSYNIKYNSSNDIFSCYTTTQTDVCIYKLDGSGTAEQLFMPKLDSPVIEAVADNETKVVTVTWTDVENATSYEVTCGTLNKTVDAGVEEASFTMDAYGTFEITVTAIADGFESAVSETTATIVDDSVSQWVDVLTRDLTGITNTTYADWSNKIYVGGSSAVYAGHSAGGNSSIQLRTTNNNSGVVSTTSGGKVSKVQITWNINTTSSRKVQIYGSNTAYSSAADLYDDGKKGTLLKTITYSTKGEAQTDTYAVSGDYKYIGIRSSSDPLYIDEIQITWVAGN